MNRYTDVFVPGGFPKHTYNPRETQQLEAKLSSARDNLCKLTTVTGHTKSGKTVLVRKIFPPDQSLWIDGGTISAEEDFWSTVINQLELFQEVEIAQSTGSESEFHAKGSAGANFLIAKGESEIGGAITSSKESVQSGTRTVSSRVAALAGLKASKRPLVVDDFHYIPKELQGDLIRTMKPLIFDGQPIVIIAIPHRRYDAIRAEKEMTARMMPIEVPSWSPEELTYIPKIGFAKLNAEISEKFALRIANESI